MRQHQEPDDYHHEDLDLHDHEDKENLEEFGRPVYQGTGLSVRALTAEELQRFLDAHQGQQPAQLLGSGWAALDPPAHHLGDSRTPPEATLPAVPARSPAGSLGAPGRSALAGYRRHRAEELAAWTSSLAWRAPLVAASGLAGQVLATRAGLPWAGMLGLAAAALVGWRLRFRPSEQARTLAARRHRRAPHRPPAPPPCPRRLRGLARPGRARLARQYRCSRIFEVEEFLLQGPAEAAWRGRR